jgi:hypothetical protein
MARPKQEYEERDADEDGTPLERFKKLAARVVAVPKEEIERREQDARLSDSTLTPRNQRRG